MLVKDSLGKSVWFHLFSPCNLFGLVSSFLIPAQSLRYFGSMSEGHIVNWHLDQYSNYIIRLWNYYVISFILELGRPFLNLGMDCTDISSLLKEALKSLWPSWPLDSNVGTLLIWNVFAFVSSTPIVISRNFYNASKVYISWLDTCMLKMAMNWTISDLVYVFRILKYWSYWLVMWKYMY